MQKKILVLCAFLALLVIAFWVGWYSGVYSRSKLQTKQDLELHKELVELDQSFFTNAVTRPSVMNSGAYTLEIQFAGKPEKVSSTLELEFSNGRLVGAPNQRIQDIVQTRNVVSWEQYDSDEGPSTTFVGVIDGDGMWGRVYVSPGQGWRQGEPPVYGVWRLRPKSGK
jgi:hypothetical protein